jgi:hypothetical protein
LRRREKIFWLAVGAALFIGFMALIPAHYEICKESAKPGEEACASYRFLPFLLVEVGKILDALGVAITALATIAIAWFTWSLRRSTDKLWDAGERQLELLSATSAAQSSEMKASVAAAEAAVNVAQDTAKRQLRAYVTVNGVIRTKDPGDLNGEGFAVLIDVKNSGQTPASDLLQWARIEIREFPLETNLPIHCLENPPRGILPPETKNLAFPTFTRALTIIEENAVLANHTAVYVYGEVDYFDVFGDRHLTQFRFRCNGQGYGLGMFKADSEGNNAN